MLQPSHDYRPYQATYSTPRRLISLGLVVAFHLLVIIAFASGLAQQAAKMMPEAIKAMIVPKKLLNEKLPPPPPPELVKPPPPFVPAPEISIQAEGPSTAITVQKQVAAPEVHKPAGITAPASIGAPHECPQDRWYPPLAIRLNQEGTTTLAFHITTDGSISDVTVAESSGYNSLDEAAVHCASASWHYKPAMQEGHPVEVPWKAIVKWQLR